MDPAADDSDQRRAENPASRPVSGLETEEQHQQAYENHAARLIDLLSATISTKSHVNSIHIRGAHHTRESFLHSVVHPAFSARTFGSVLETVQRAVDDLRRFDIFDELDLVFDSARDPSAAEESVNVHLTIKEKNRVFVKTGTEIGNGEGNMNGSINVRNVFGGAETLETNISFGTRTSSAFHFCLAKPVNASPNARVDVNAFNLVRNNTQFSSHEESLRGGGIRFRALSGLGYHELSYDVAWRTIDRLAETASLSIRNQAGHSLKSSITHIFTRDRRDDPLLPTRGYFVRMQQELAGTSGLGDARFLKNEVEAQVASLLGLGVVLSTTLRGGLLYTLDGTPSKISDRFMLGGPSSVRGFRTGGIGPRDQKDALGGDAYWAAGVSLTSPLPRLSDYPVKVHLFVNAGTLVPYDHTKTPQETLESLGRSPSVAVGLGLIYRHSIARLEANFCVPLTIAAGDQYMKGLQIGLGLSFL